MRVVEPGHRDDEGRRFRDVVVDDGPVLPAMAAGGTFGLDSRYDLRYLLRGGGPPGVVELTLVLAREMLSLAGVADVDPAEVLASGKAYATGC